MKKIEKFEDRIVILDNEDAWKEFGKFQREEQLYEMDIDIRTPDGTIFRMPVVFQPATAYMIAKLYEDVKPDQPVEEQYDRLAELFSARVKNLEFVNVGQGKANYTKKPIPEISVQDLTMDARRMLEMAIAPGVGKSNADIERELAQNRRKIGKGMRRPTTGMAEPLA